MPGATKVFISYSSADEEFCQALERHLSLLKREGAIETWTFRSIDAGDDWKAAIDARLETAQLILLLVSAHFVASDYCWNIEMKRALQRHRDRSARVVPIIVRDCDWSSAPFAALQALPPSAKPVTSWRPQDKAWTAIAQALRKVVAEPLSASASGAADAVPETAVQRAQRLAAESRARKALDDKWIHEAARAFESETRSVFEVLERRATEIVQTTEIPVKAGWRSDHCIVRMNSLRQNIYPLCLHMYPYFDGITRDKSHLNTRLVFGGMLLPDEQGYYLDKPKEHRSKRCVFRLTSEGQWVWFEPSTEQHLRSEELADVLLGELLQLHDDIETGKVKQPKFY